MLMKNIELSKNNKIKCLSSLIQSSYMLNMELAQRDNSIKDNHLRYEWGQEGGACG